VLRTPILRSVLAVVCIVGLALCLSLAGLSPLGGDPDLMYKPIKSELSRSLAAGQLPFWSDRFGIGAPLVAESHVAAFYPPNYPLYRLCNVRAAYRMAMWLHWLVLAVTTFAYARTLGINKAGSALAAVSFTLCGFQAAHIVHEPFNHLMPYLPLCLLLADRFMSTGSLVWLSSLAIAWGIQLTIGHFQIQMWTAGLVLIFGMSRVWAAGELWKRHLWRMSGLFVALFWGLLIAWVQLRLTWELTGVAGFVRPPHLVAPFSFPPAHWAQFALPEVYLGLHQGTGDAYWGRHGTISGEACAYAGIVVWILAFVGATAKPRFQGLGLWKVIVPLSLLLATMPGWWPDAFYLLMRLPGLGWFRAPARYTLLTSLGLALLGGRGLDHSITPRRFRAGVTLAIAFGALAWFWSIYWTSAVDFRTSHLAPTLMIRFSAAGLTWILALITVIAWRVKRLGAWALLTVALFELAVLLFVGPVVWVRTNEPVEASPVMQRLAKLQDVGLVAGRLQDLPVTAGKTVAFPYLGITPPPPNYMLEAALSTPPQNDIVENRWLRRLGVTHGIWGSADVVRGTDVVARINDPLLDRVMGTIPASKRSGLSPWSLVRVVGTFPPAWVAREVHEAPNWKLLFWVLSDNDARDEAWFEPGDAPQSFPKSTNTSADVKSWDGKTAIVEHDGPCILILRRAYYPGWFYRLDDLPERPVLKVNCGLQAVPLLGSGIRRITFHYHPTGLPQAAAISLTALALALTVLLAARLRAFRLLPWVR
jgi:hypothetical protein